MLQLMLAFEVKYLTLKEILMKHRSWFQYTDISAYEFLAE